MIADGFGPGALVEVGHPRSSGTSVLAVVTGVEFGSLVDSAKVKKGNYFQGHRGVNFQYVVPIDDSWGGAYKNGSCYTNLKYLNIDDIPESDWYRTPNNSEATLLSGVEMSEDQLLSEDVLDLKKVSKWITDNVVDPK